MCSCILFIRFCCLPLLFLNVLKSLHVHMGAEKQKPKQNNNIVLSSVGSPHDYLQDQILCLCPY